MASCVIRSGGDVVEVGTIYGIGRNYVAHAQELGNEVPSEPVVFLKARTSLRGLDPTPVAFPAEDVHHEVEIVLLVGRTVPLGSDPGWAAVSDIALGLDITRRGVQERAKRAGLPWTAAKSFAGSAVTGPFLPTTSLGDLADLAFSLDINGERRQSGHVSRMLFDVPTILKHLASLAELSAGDLVFTGTPEGVGPMRVGDTFRMSLVTSDRRTQVFEGRY